MRCHLHKEAAWIPIAVVQHLQCDNISAGLSAVMAVILRAVHSQSCADGFALPALNQRRVKINTQGYFLSDQDAQRGTWHTKGSAGLKPCMFCSNITKKNSLPDSTRFLSICSAEKHQFRCIYDADWTEAHAHLATMSRKDRVDWEKAYGLQYQPHGMVADGTAFAALPPSRACNDAMHCYYANGIASLELQLIVQALAEHGLALSSLRELASASAWLGGLGTRPAYLLADEMFEDKMYKGDAKHTLACVYLMLYYLDILFPDDHQLAKEKSSMIALKQCCAELQSLHTCWTSITESNQIRCLDETQIKHQRFFGEAYEKDLYRPKHHHRLHLPEATLQLGFLPRAACQEKKHQALKGRGLVNDQKGKLSNPVLLQRGLLPRLLLDTIQLANDFGLAQWELLPPLRVPALEWRGMLRDPGAVAAREMQLLQINIHVGGVIFHGAHAARVRVCLRDSHGNLFLGVQPLAFHKRCCWGTIWNIGSQEALLVPVQISNQIHAPVWWREEGNRYFCLH